MNLPTTTRLLQELVRLPSVNPMGRLVQGPQYYEHQVTAYLEQFLRDLRRRSGRDIRS